MTLVCSVVSAPAVTMMPRLLIGRILLIEVAMRGFRVERWRDRAVGRIREDRWSRKTSLPVEEIKIIILCSCKWIHEPICMIWSCPDLCRGRSLNQPILIVMHLGIPSILLIGLSAAEIVDVRWFCTAGLRRHALER